MALTGGAAKWLAAGAISLGLHGLGFAYLYSGAHEGELAGGQLSTAYFADELGEIAVATEARLENIVDSLDSAYDAVSEPVAADRAAEVAALVADTAFAKIVEAADETPPEIEFAAMPSPPRKPQPQARAPRSTASAATASTGSRRPATQQNNARGQGQGEMGADELSRYQGRIRAHLVRHRRYPVEMVAVRARGDARVRFNVSAAGEVSGLQLAATSGWARLDDEALATVRRASPMPAMDNPSARPVTVIITITFEP